MTATGFLGELWGRRSFVVSRVVDDPVAVAADQEDARRIPMGDPDDAAGQVTIDVPVIGMELITIRRWKPAMDC